MASTEELPRRHAASRVLAGVVAPLAVAALLGCPGIARADEATLAVSDTPQMTDVMRQTAASDGSSEARTSQVERLLRQAVATHEQTVDVSGVGASKDEVLAAWTTVVNDPEIYTLFAESVYTFDSSKVISVRLSYAVPVDELDAYEAKVEAKVAEALTWTDSSMDMAHRAQALHDYLVRNCAYDSDAARYTKDVPQQYRASYTAIGALVDGRAVCQGYADAYSLLLARAGIESTYVSSAAMNHGWNMVKVGDRWYHVDVTWDDSGNGGADQGFDADVSHADFLKSDETMRSLGHYGWTSSHLAPSDYQMTYGTYKGRYVRPAAPAPVATQPMYRLYNPNSGEHFYTASARERDDVVRAGWNYEGVGWTAPVKSDTPVFRLYNPNAGDHHYTTDSAERINLMSLGWRYEGIGWYSADASQGARVPLLRQYNPNAKSGSHNFTTSQAENDHLVSLGWRAEGIGWYGIK